MARTDEEHYYSLKKFLREHLKPSYGFAEFVAVGLARDGVRKMAFGPRRYREKAN